MLFRSLLQSRAFRASTRRYAETREVAGSMFHSRRLFVNLSKSDSAEQFLAQRKFGTVTTIAADQIRIEAKQPIFAE